MTVEIRNPAKLPTDLNLAEKEFMRCLAAGKVCIIGNGELPEKEIKSGNDANVVRREVIRFFAYGGNEKNLVLGPIIELHGAWISGEESLDLIHANMPYALNFTNCHFAVSVEMLHAECAGLYLHGSHFVQGLLADGLTTKGDVHLGHGFSAEGEVQLLKADIGGDLDCTGGKFHNPNGDAFFANGLTTKGDVHLGHGFSAEGEVRLLKANIGGDLDCTGGKFYNPNGDAFFANGLTTKGDVHLGHGFSAEGEVQLLKTDIGGDLSCRGGKFHNPGGYALDVDGLMTKGDVNLGHGFSAEGEVQLWNVNIGGGLSCMEGKFHNPDGDALFANGLMTKGNMNLGQGFSAEGQVWLWNTNIGGDLDCTGGKFRSANKDALFVDNLTTKGDVNLIGKFSAEGEVRLLSMSIDGDLSCRGGKFHNPDGDALYVVGLITKGDVYLGNDFSAEGEVQLWNTNIGGDLDCTDGKFHNPDGDALFANGLTTKGAMCLGRGFSSEGQVWLWNANIGGDLDCAGGKFHAPGGTAFFADGLTTKGDVNLSGKFSSEGEVRLWNANIGGDLSCKDGRFHNPDGDAFDVIKGNISGSLFWWETTCTGAVNLAYAKVDMLVDDADSWKSCKVNLDGFIYGQFANPADAQFRLDWLSKRPDGILFSPQPYEQAAKALRAVGKHIDAWDIERKKRRLERAERYPSSSFKIPGWRRLWGWAIDALTDFVYRPWKTVGWAIAIVCVSALLFNFADKSGRIVPHQPIVVANLGYQLEAFPRCVEFQCPPERRPTNVVRRLLLDYPKFNALVYSADVFIPFFALHQEPYWYPNPSDADQEILFRILLFWYWLEIIAGWILTSLFLLSVTGLLRPRQSSGEKN